MSTNLLQKTLFRTTFCLVAATAAAQSPAPGEPTPAPERVAERAAEADVSKWIQQLGSDSYRARLEAENRLKQLGERQPVDVPPDERVPRWHGVPVGAPRHDRARRRCTYHRVAALAATRGRATATVVAVAAATVGRGGRRRWRRRR